MKNLLLTILTFFSITIYGQNGNKGQLGFDGLYETKCLIEEDDDEGTQSYLRFYPNGTVIYVAVDCDGTVDDLKNWFHINAEQVSLGEYKIKGQKIFFSTTSKSGIVNYKGKIMTNGSIKLKWKSQINGEHGHENYKFIGVDGLR